MEKFDYNQTYYKIINKEMKHNDLSYCDENQNIILDTVINDCLPFEKEGTCVKGGIYFTDKYHIYNYSAYGIYIAEIIIPQDALVVKDYRKWRANKIIIKSLTKISDFTFNDDSWFDYEYTIFRLINIITYSNDKYKELASDKLLKQKPDNCCLYEIIRYSTEKYKNLASEKLLKQKPSNIDLCNIIINSTKKYKEIAWDKLLKHKHKRIYQFLDKNQQYKYDLYYIIRSSNDKYQELASDKLLLQNPSNCDLINIIIYSTEKYKELASEKLLKQNPSIEDLKYIIEHSTEKYKELAQNMLNKNNI